MTYTEYATACKKFAADTTGWAALDPRQFYTTTDDYRGWAETPDNAHGGFSVSWAFHSDSIEIDERAPAMYARQIVSTTRAMLDNGADADELYSFLDSFHD